MGFESWGWKEGVLGLIAFSLFVVHVFDTFQTRIKELEEKEKKLVTALNVSDVEYAKLVADARSVNEIRTVERANIASAIGAKNKVIEAKNKTIQLLSKANLELTQMLGETRRLLEEARNPRPEDWN